MKPIRDTAAFLLALTLLAGCQPPSNVLSTGQEDNLISNGDFSQGAQDWSTYVQNGGAVKLSVDPGRADLTSLTAGTGVEQYFDVQFKHSSPGFSLVTGRTYTLTFEAWADAQRFLAVSVWENGRDLNGDGSAWGSHCFWYADLTTSPQTFSRTFTMTLDNPSAGLCFACGVSTASVHLANVRLVRN